MVALAVAVVPLGAVVDPVSAVALMLFAGLAVVASVLPLRRQLSAPLVAAVALLALITTGAILQTLPLGLAHPSWAEASDILGPLSGAISVYPAATFHALGDLFIPALAFMTAIVMFQEDADCEALIRWLAALGLAGAILGIYEFFLSPHTVVFMTRERPSDGVSAFFRNRNTAATFLGIAAVIWSGFLLRRLQELGPSGLASLIRDNRGSSRTAAIALVALLLGLAAVLVALFLTKSRAGTASALAGMFVMLVAMTGAGGAEAAGRRRLAYAVAVSGAVVAMLFSLYGGQLADRMGSLDASRDGRWCFYESMMAAIRDRPLTGTGFGALQFAFPAYREGDCMPLDLYLDMGHNGYLEIAMGLGLGALAMIFGAVAVLGAILVRGVRLRQKMKFAPAAGLATLVIVTLHSALDFSVQIPGMAAYAAVALAAGVIASRPRADAPGARRRRRSPAPGTSA